ARDRRARAGPAFGTGGAHRARGSQLVRAALVHDGDSSKKQAVKPGRHQTMGHVETPRERRRGPQMASSRMARNTLAALVGSVFAVGMMVSTPASAQLSTSTIRGHITGPSSAGARISATNVATGFSARATVGADGAYSLTGLPPGTYRIEVAGQGFDQKTQDYTVQVGQTAELDISVGPNVAKADTIVVSGNRLLETKTSEIATYITPRQMDRLPQVTRNFLAFADLAPGVQF